MFSTLRTWCLISLSAWSAFGLSADWLFLENMTLIDGRGGETRSIERLAVRDGIIVSLGDNDQASTPAPMDRATRIDLAGAWVMPGLIDTHVHVARFPETRSEAERILRQAVRGGITSVRDLGGDARALADIQRALIQKELVGPTLVYAALFGGPDLFRDPRIAAMTAGYDSGSAPWAQAVQRETNLALGIAMARGSGTGGIKLYANLDARIAKAIISEANSQGLAGWAHATVFPAGPGDLVEAGIDSLSHAPYLVWEAVDEIPKDYEARTKAAWSATPANHPKILALFQKMAKKGVFLDATLFVFKAMGSFSPQVKADWTADALSWAAKATALAHKQGVRVTTGTDWFEARSPNDLPNTHEELALLVEMAGFTPMEAIVAATQNGAASLGVASQRGTLEVGKAADLLILNANPLQDIRNTRQIRLVVKNGILVEPLR